MPPARGRYSLTVRGASPRTAARKPAPVAGAQSVFSQVPFAAMIQAFLTLLILAVDPAAPMAEGDRQEVFHCAFDQPWDTNYDGWPDGWSRRRGKGYPEYLSIKIAGDGQAEGSRCLEVRLDGGAAAVYSPAISASPLCNYLAEVAIDTSGLAHDEAYLSLTLLDANRRKLETYQSEKAGPAEEWRTIQLGPVEPKSGKVCYAVVGLHVEPGRQADLEGLARFTDVALARMPRIRLSMANAHHLFTEPGAMEVLCTVSGISSADQSVDLVLEDGLGETVAEVTRKLEMSAAVGQQASAAPDAALLAGTTRWRIPAARPGLYRVRAELAGRRGAVDCRDLTAALLAPLPEREGGRFGWSFSSGDLPLSLGDLAKVLGQAGIGWVKYPMWLGADADEKELQELARFGERLDAHGIRLVGVLGEPPPEIRAALNAAGPLPAAAAFSAPDEVWYPSIEPALARMASQVRWWQIGTDADTGFVNYPGLHQKAAMLKARLEQAGFGVNIGLGWGWLNELPPGGAPWRFVALSCQPPLTAEELPGYLQAAERPGVQRWVAIDPLAKSEYSLKTRILDLVERMVTAKIHGAEAIFISDPIGEQTGLLREDGAPGELFLPWRTTALVLSSTEYLGEIRLPGGSQNRIFLRGDEAIMVLWNNVPTREALYLGKEVRQVDLWGAQTVPRRQGDWQVIEADRFPVFVTGLDPSIVRWRQEFAFDEPEIPIIFGKEYSGGYTIRNTFDRPVSVKARLAGPEVWRVSPPEVSLRLEKDEEHHQPFRIRLPEDTTIGDHDVRLDVEIQGDEPLRFSSFRQMYVGLGHIRLEARTRLNERGELEIEQQLTNDTDEPISFRCYLYVPDRRRRQLDVIELGHGRDAQCFRLPDGRGLIGQTLWLQAEEIGGNRLLNYRFQARP